MTTGIRLRITKSSSRVANLSRNVRPVQSVRLLKIESTASRMAFSSPNPYGVGRFDRKSDRPKKKVATLLLKKAWTSCEHPHPDRSQTGRSSKASALSCGLNASTKVRCKCRKAANPCKEKTAAWAGSLPCLWHPPVGFRAVLPLVQPQTEPAARPSHAQSL